MATVTYRTCDRCGEQISNIARSSVIGIEYKMPPRYRAVAEGAPLLFDLCNACTSAFHSFTQELREGGGSNSEAKSAD